MRNFGFCKRDFINYFAKSMLYFQKTVGYFSSKVVFKFIICIYSLFNCYFHLQEQFLAIEPGTAAGIGLAQILLHFAGLQSGHRRASGKDN